MITDRQLALIAPNCPRLRRAEVLPHLQETLHRYEINTVTRVAAFLANVLLESGEFKWTKEIWGNTPAQRRYDVGKKALDLGNTPEADGDGKKFMGHGWIQTTGKRNHKRVGDHLGVDFVARPELLGEYPYCALSAGFYWQDRKLNCLADQLEGGWDAEERAVFTRIVKGVNGGTMHFEERVTYYRRAIHVLRNIGGFGFISPQLREKLSHEKIAGGVASDRTRFGHVPTLTELRAVDSRPDAGPAPTPAPAPAAPPAAPAGTYSTADAETREGQTRIIDMAAQQVTPAAAKSLAQKSWARAQGPFLKFAGWLFLALQAGNVFAWAGVAVLALATVWALFHYRRQLLTNFYYLASKVQGKFA